MSRGPRYTPEEDSAILDAFTPRSVRMQLCAGRLGRTEAAVRRRYQRLVNGDIAPYIARSRDKALR